jgi:hypothetical protein
VLNSIFVQICIYFVLGNEKVMCYFLQTTSERKVATTLECLNLGNLFN